MHQHECTNKFKPRKNLIPCERKLKQINYSSFQLENLGIITAHEKTKQMTLKGK